MNKLILQKVKAITVGPAVPCRGLSGMFLVRDMTVQTNHGEFTVELFADSLPALLLPGETIAQPVQEFPDPVGEQQEAGMSESFVSWP